MAIKVITATGYAPVRALTVVGNWRPGDVFGLVPEVAAKAVAAGEVELVAPPDDVETFDWESGATTLSAPMEHHGGGEKKPAEVHDPATVEIPEGWRDAHARTVIAIARKLGGGKDVDTKAEAIPIVEAELARRASAAAPPPPVQNPAAPAAPPDAAVLTPEQVPGAETITTDPGAAGG